jgi:phosphatidate cytidylyltransferase
VTAGLSFLCLREFYNVAALSGHQPSSLIGLLCGLGLNLLFFFYSRLDIDATIFVLMFPMLSSILIFKLYQSSKGHPFIEIAFTFLGIFHIALPFAILHLATMPNGIYNYKILFCIFFILWIHDIGAFFAGKYFGRHQLFAKISPSKTWEGSIGGSICAITMVFILNYSFEGIDLYHWLGVAIIIIIFGTYGDLIESLYKRSLNIKDTSNAMPGHGGFLDRFDGLILSIPFVVAYLILVRF